MNEYYSVININTGKKVCECATLEDAQMVVGFDPVNRAYRRDRFILDQVIDVTSTTDKQLPGQLGLPEGKHPLPSIQEQILLPKSEAIPINI
jgi:hypothetical protein